MTRAEGRLHRLLATDLDGTFIGDDEAMHRLWEELEASGIAVAFSTGRHLTSILDFYEACGTSRRADSCVCMVGTEIWHRADGGYRRDEGWGGVISEAWNRPEVEAIVQAIPEARRQPAEWQSDFKISYFLEDETAWRVDEINRRLQRLGLRAKVVYSAGLFLDLLPYRSGKGEAVRYLAAGLGIEAGQVITAGDTGNDLDMMRPELGFRSVVVGNAADELSGYRAPGIYHARAPFAAGIREGLVHHGWLPR